MCKSPPDHENVVVILNGVGRINEVLNKSDMTGLSIYSVGTQKSVRINPLTLRSDHFLNSPYNFNAL